MIEDRERLHDKSSSTARDLGLDGEIGGPEDAYRHAFTAGAMSLKHDPWIVALAGHANEWNRDFESAIGLTDLPAKPGERAMDLINNRLGIQLAKGAVSEAEVSERVLSALRDGRLQVLPDPSVGYTPFNRSNPAVRSSKRRRIIGQEGQISGASTKDEALPPILADVDAEIAKIERRMRDDRYGYFADEQIQRRYRMLLEQKSSE